jgi:hypothetical protein
MGQPMGQIRLVGTPVAVWNTAPTHSLLAEFIAFVVITEVSPTARCVADAGN